MDIISDLSIQKRKKDRMNLSLNGKYYCSLNLETVIKYNLKKGSMITPARLQQIQIENEETEAFNSALNLVNKHYKTRHELKEYLKNKGYLDKVVKDVLVRLNEYGYVDDVRYSETFLSHHKNKGKNLLKQELWQKGVNEEIINKTISEMGDQTEVIKALSEKYMKNKEENRANYAKLVRYLINRGFGYEEILKILKKEVEEWKLELILLKRTDSIIW